MEKFKLTLASLLAFLLVGCSISPTSLSCGVDGDESYVTLENLKDNNPQTIKTYAAICGFAYDQVSDDGLQSVVNQE